MVQQDKQRIIKIPNTTTLSYLSVLNFIFKMTDRELEVMAELVNWEHKIRINDLGISPFGTDVRGKIADKLAISNFNTYILKLKRKQAIKKDDKGNLIINPLLALRESNEITFRFEPNNK